MAHVFRFLRILAVFAAVSVPLVPLGRAEAKECTNVGECLGDAFALALYAWIALPLLAWLSLWIVRVRRPWAHAGIGAVAGGVAWWGQSGVLVVVRDGAAPPPVGPLGLVVPLLVAAGTAIVLGGVLPLPRPLHRRLWVAVPLMLVATAAFTEWLGEVTREDARVDAIQAAGVRLSSSACR